MSLQNLTLTPMKNLYFLLSILATSAHAEFNSLWVSKYDNLIVELGDNKYESSIIRSYEDTINLGIDPVTGLEWHPHKSAKFVFNVNCNTNSLALTGWSLYSDTSGKGEIVWADTDYGKPNYYTPVTEDEVNLTSNLCASRIASN